MERLRKLLTQYLNRLLLREEPTDYKEADHDPLFEKVMARADAIEAARAGDEPAGAEQAGGERSRIVRIGDRRRWGVAAAAVLFLLAGTVWLGERSRMQRAPVAVVAKVVVHDAFPGSSKAILTLANGKQVVLDPAHDGVIGRQGGSALVSRNERLVYERAPDGADNADGTDGAGGADGAGGMGFNVLTTPRGGQYSVVLPDGTRVWLNADSYLRYPTGFSGSERVVELRGEGYFEVAAKSGAPFRVDVLRKDGEPMRVEVLGTHFNIMDYADEPAIRTTLLEGAVRVSKGGAAVVLRPGQQARLAGEDRLSVSAVDVEEAVAWKEGLFKFNGADIGQVMRQLSRWYDLDVEYTNGVPKDLFQGEMYRNVHVNELLKILEASGVHCSVEGKKLLVK